MTAWSLLLKFEMLWVKTFHIPKVNTDKASVTCVIPKTIHCLIFAFRATNAVLDPDVRDLKNVRCLIITSLLYSKWQPRSRVLSLTRRETGRRGTWERGCSRWLPFCDACSVANIPRGVLGIRVNLVTCRISVDGQIRFDYGLLVDVNPERKSCGFKQIRIRVDRSLNDPLFPPILQEIIGEYQWREYMNLLSFFFGLNVWAPSLRRFLLPSWDIS